MLFYWLLSSAFRAQPGRWLVAGFMVALGIALAVAIHTVNRSALGEFGRALDLVNGQASAQLVSVSGDLPDSVFDEIVARQQALGIKATSPVLKRDTRLITVLGIDVFRAAQVTPALMPSAASGQGMTLFGGDSIFLSAAALQSLDLVIGDPLTLPIGDREETFIIAGLVPGAAGQSLAVMDLGLAQWRLNGLGQLSRLDIVPEPGQSFDAIARAVGALNLGLTLVTADDRDRRMSNLSRAYRVNLSVLALVALFTGAFLVFTTISFSVLRQQSQLALLSVLGAKRQWLFALVLTQALMVTALGGLLGLGIGLGLAALLLRVAGGDLGGGYFSTAVPPLDIDPVALVGFWMLSLAVGVLAGGSRRAPAQTRVALSRGDWLRPDQSGLGLHARHRWFAHCRLLIDCLSLVCWPSHHAVAGQPKLLFVRSIPTAQQIPTFVVNVSHLAPGPSPCERSRPDCRRDRCTGTHGCHGCHGFELSRLGHSLARSSATSRFVRQFGQGQ